MAASDGSAAVIVIGAGIAGCALAHGLAKRGQKVLVLEQGPLGRSKGSSFHAPGGIAVGDRRSRLMTQFAQTSMKLYSSMGTLWPCPGLTIARTEEDLAALREDIPVWKSYGIDVRIETAQEAALRHPALDPKSFSGAMHYHSARANASATCEALRMAAEKMGAKFEGDVQVTKIDLQTKTVHAGDRRFSAQHVVVCTGGWTNATLQLAGVDPLPLATIEHPWLLTPPLDEMAKSFGCEPSNSPGDPNLQFPHQALPSPLPQIWDVASGVYVHAFGSRLGLGSYDHKAIVDYPDTVASLEKAGKDPMTRPFTADDVSLDKIGSIMPILQTRKPDVAFNGIMTYAVDGCPVVGQMQPGLWICSCVYVWHAGGAAEALAEWMATGKQPEDFDEVNVSRLFNNEATVEEIRRKVGKVYESRASDHAEEDLAPPTATPARSRL
eukprot:TRINITY_DN112028_c0_g1_i1.p1 TRINITY_DN112028_c0_g1~~TRINITY_DN112028_c0_g1_i1.p1  ORF type:complete len:439 (-),score=63.60 TRINITY_DN112028_c0_g1_i1:352-1668(-)